MENTYQIFTNRGLGFDDIPDKLGYNLDIWAYNFWSGTYTDAQGNTRRGKTCAMSLTVQDESAPELRARLYVGQEFTYSRYEIRIVNIGSEKGKPFVELVINRLEDLPVEWDTTITAEGDGPYIIPENVQLIYSDNNLLIGAGNIYVDHIEQQGEKKRVEGAGLWLSTRDGETPNQNVWLYGGQETTYGPYLIRVIEAQYALTRGKYEEPSIVEIAIDVVE